MNRVVVTGMAGLTSLGHDWETISAAMRRGATGIRQMPEWAHLVDLRTRLGAPVDDFDHAKVYPRKTVRSMGRVAVMSVRVAELALEQAGLRDDPALEGGRVGVAFGSSFGSTAPPQDFVDFVRTGKASGLTATSYIRMMSHTTAVNIGVTFKTTGRIIPTSSACTSGSQGIGYAFEAIRTGRADAMIAGGAEEHCPTMAMVFDTLFATSLKNDQPATASRPFDLDRDGLVIGEGAAVLILESADHARARGATILAEIVGFGTNSDGAHITQPAAPTQATAMRLALDDAGLAPTDIQFVSAHGTATTSGDVVEAESTNAVFGDGVPVHSLKGHFGHTLGACGAIEAWLAIEMMREGWFPATANLDRVDPACARLDFVQGEGRRLDVEHLVTNNFAFGGINTSLVIRRI